ncbi:hypothetical protein FRC03_004461 [Tulasnella sp. 419]|nr:hypothetical protein FRC03_004461 [Tulasnella sp. 419]
MASNIVPFSIHVPDEVLEDLGKRLDNTRYPQELHLHEGERWSYGTPKSTVAELVDYWRTEFNWRKIESELNTKLPQYMATIDTGDPEQGILDVHFAHKRSSRPGAIPLIVIHGWPGNFAEVLKVIDGLTEPEDPKHPAYHVVSPSIPGFGFSSPARAPGMGMRMIAKIFDKLMKALGYDHYMAQGGDWGALIVRGLAIWHPSSCIAIHSTMFFAHPKLLIRHPLLLLKTIWSALGLPGGYSKGEMDGLKSMKAYVEGNEETGYSKIQGTKPQTLGFAMTDSPAGLLAWLREKYESWTDEYHWTHEELLMWVMFYWIPGPTPSFRIYKEAVHVRHLHDMDEIISQWSPSFLGVSVFQKESLQVPNDYGSMVQPLRFVKRRERGGHFVAWENPRLFLDDVRAFTAEIISEDAFSRVLHT